MTSSTYAMREAAPRDVPAILALYAQPDYDNGKVLDAEQAGKIFARMQLYPWYKFFVAARPKEHVEAVLGVYSLLIMENMGHLGAPSAIVEGVAVDPALQGQGIGEAMMRHAIATASEMGCYKLALSSNLKRKRAHAFYENLGFEQHGVSFTMNLENVQQGALQ